jgi:two-component system, NarL family, sensor histidine kinase UhpB
MCVVRRAAFRCSPHYRAAWPTAYVNPRALLPDTVKREIRILLLEDETADAELVKFALREGGLAFTLQRVETREDFLCELERHPPDLVLSDYSLPAFDGVQALTLLKERLPEVPLIFVTGTLGEERAIETLKRGATDFILKTRLSRLVPAVHRALREAEERAERRRAEEQLRESHEQLRALSVYLQHVREEERTRIAREVHDELGQALTGLKFDLSSAPADLPKAPKSFQAKVAALCARIDAIIQTIRRISTELRPGILDDLGLVAAIEWQANEFQLRTGIPCHVSTNLEEPVLNDDAKTALFRILQETLTNVLRHAKAGKVAVQLTRSNGRVRLEVRDDGCGIPPDVISSTRSLGLLGMRERATLLGGDFHIGGANGGGTIVTVSVPHGRASNHARASG